MATLSIPNFVVHTFNSHHLLVSTQHLLPLTLRRLQTKVNLCHLPFHILKIFVHIMLAKPVLRIVRPLQSDGGPAHLHLDGSRHVTGLLSAHFEVHVSALGHGKRVGDISVVLVVVGVIR